MNNVQNHLLAKTRRKKFIYFIPDVIVKIPDLIEREFQGKRQIKSNTKMYRRLR